MDRLTHAQEVSVMVDTIREDLGQWVTITPAPQHSIYDWLVELRGENAGRPPLLIAEESMVLHPEAVLAAVLRYIERSGAGNE